MNKITCTVDMAVVKDKTYAFTKTSDRRLLIQEIKPAPFLAPPVPSREEQDQLMIQMRKAGHSVGAISDAVGVSQAVVSRMTKHLGMPRVDHR